MVIQYKCPDCGADMIFDSNTGLLTCESCGHVDKIEDYKAKTEQTTSNSSNNASDSSTTNNNVSEYTCKNCGAVLVTDKDTSATICGFCGAAMVLEDRVSGNFAPSKIIPFTISKEQAQAAFKKWCKKGLLTPKGFMNADRIKNITGIYVPFWLYDINGSGNTNATCTTVRHYTSGEYDYTETKYYDVYRAVDLNYLKIPVDASEKMDDQIMDKLEPFNYSDLKDFNTPYLAGYVAEKYNYDDHELFKRVETRVDKYVEDYIRSTMSLYSTVSFTNKSVGISPTNTYYTLLPVWTVCYDYNNSEHNFAMNGETGKIVGKPPISKGKVAAWFSGIGVVSLFIIKLIAYIIGGVL